MLFNTLSLVAALPVLATLVTAVPQKIHGRSSVEVVSNCKVDGQIALTADDGPYIYESNFANNLQGAKATFFLNGNNYNCIYDHADEIQALHAAGHTLGSHTWSHPHLNDLTWDQVHDELWKVEEAFIKILGLKPRFFRPPYGEYNDNVLAVLESRGYTKAFLWDLDTEDASGATIKYSKGIYNQAANSYPQPHMILEHSVLEPTADTLVPYAVKRLEAVGYSLVAVDTCLGSDGEWPYVYVGEPQARDSSWHC